MLLLGAAELKLKSGAGKPRSGECGVGGLGDFDSAIKEILSGSEELEMRAEVVGCVGVEAEVAVQREEVCIVVILTAADAALQAECAETRFESSQIQGPHVRATSGIQLPRSCEPRETTAC